MDHVTYMLSFSRLARRTAVFWGHATTSGVSSADSYLSVASSRHSSRSRSSAKSSSGISSSTRTRMSINGDASSVHKNKESESSSENNTKCADADTGANAYTDADDKTARLRRRYRELMKPAQFAPDEIYRSAELNGGIDYFISSHLFEPEGMRAQLKYSERLVITPT